MVERHVSKLSLEWRLELAHIERLLIEAHRLSQHTEFVIVGSLSALGVIGLRPIPPRMLMSIDVDCYMRDDPARTFELNPALGEGSVFERENGYYLDPISPTLPTLPDGWEYRLLRVDFPSGVTAHFLDPNDAAVSKYARGEPRDREWIRAGLATAILSAPIIASRFRQTAFLDDAEAQAAKQRLAEDEVWLSDQPKVKTKRKPAAGKTR